MINDNAYNIAQSELRSIPPRLGVTCPAPGMEEGICDSDAKAQREKFTELLDLAGKSRNSTIEEV